MLQLLEKVKILNKFHKQINELSDERFNMFRVCGVNHYEVTHSSILCELLRNDASHNFKNKFLEAFIETLKKENTLAEDYEFSFVNIKVIPEFSVGSLGRIDILIKNDKQCIIVENKIYAGDQFKQLERYEKFAKENYENHQLLYLTLWGDEASEQSSKDVDYKQISYASTIINWIERCIEISARNPVIRETLIQYINHLKYLTNNLTLSKMNNELVEFLAQEDNIEATFSIGDNLNNVKNYLINKVFVPQLAKVCDELNLELNLKLKFHAEEYDRVNTPYSSFIIHNHNWDFFKIRFEFQAKGLRNLIAGINHIDINHRNDKVFSDLKERFSKKNDNWVWSDFPKYNYWGKEAMIAIIKNGEMAGIFKEEIMKILNKTEGLKL